jgi:alkanesulfonate monooxygenase SsuD/methylene tetrahydromethanopterin reductase-like flavin-dependent oxidoreductase (luciferase family)
VSLRTAYPPHDPRLTARWLRERVEVARDHGLDSLFVGDTHTSGPNYAYFQNVPTLAHLLTGWDHRPVGAFFLLPLWSPVLVAEQCATVAVLTPGRFILQTAIGPGGGAAAAMGQPRTGRVARFEANLAVVRALLAGERVRDDATGIHGACIAPLPPEPIEVWIGATAPAGIERAARLGDGWIANAHVTVDEAREQLDLYRHACAIQGRAVGTTVIRRDVHVGADDVQATAAGDVAVAAGYRGFRREALTYGGVDSVTAQFAQYAAMGYDEILVRHFSDDHAEVLKSLERVGQVRAALA